MLPENVPAVSKDRGNSMAETDETKRNDTVSDDFLEETDEASVRPEKASKKGKNRIYDVLLVVFALIFLYCAFQLISYYVKGARYKKEMSRLSEEIGGGISQNEEDLAESLRMNRDRLVFPDEEEHELVAYVSSFTEEITDTWHEQYSVLVGKNRDCIGYIEIPDTTMSYPVMFCPSQYDYYLNRNLDKKNDVRGLPFMDGATKIGLSRNYILYGHDMRDGTSFGLLRKYKDKAYAEEHPYVYFNTAISTGVYQVMYVCRSKIYAKDDKVFKYYQYGGVLSEEQFNTYVKEMRSRALYTCGFDAVWGDELLSLSTCDHYVEDGRLIIVCKRVK